MKTVHATIKEWAQSFKSKLIASLAGCVAFISTGCNSPNVRYADLQPPPTATVDRGIVTVHIGSDMSNSFYFTRPSARIDDHTVFVSGYHSSKEQSREFVIRLPAFLNAKNVEIIWVDPDGTKIPIPQTADSLYLTR